MNLSSLNRIVVTGGAGFLGSRVIEQLRNRGVAAEKIHIPRSSSCDLRDLSACLKFMERADLVIHLAAKVGGIGFNQRHPGELFYDNATMGINTIEASRRLGVKKVVVAGTICAYPRHTPVPFKEEDLWNGFPEETNAPYGVAKKSLWMMLDAYRAQYGLNGVFLLPVNLYGPGDNFHLENSHVIPALIRKFCEAKEKQLPSVTLWGDGSPSREFLYVDDAARGIVKAAEAYDCSDPVNLGTSEEIKIKDLAELVKKKTNYTGGIIWDTSRPNGQERRKLSVTRAEQRFQFHSEIRLEQGLEKTIQWWLEIGRKITN